MRDIEEIRRLIPLRFPYLMIDRILEEVPDRVVGLKNVSVNEPFFQGHFPEPLPAIMPGTLILEAMAQVAAFLLLSDEAPRALGYLVGVDKARFRKHVVPGDQLRIQASMSRRRRGLLVADVVATVGDSEVASAQISLLPAKP
ncbi:MAG: 3-hydroxyacyl-ACP dehydratase FabZ [Candidatus Bipolaricaulota bacterium]|nr:3-hydroxyacyl-ACP dehydratase FabZ [Candidatus Bipolaricaulota bacterium]